MYNRPFKKMPYFAIAALICILHAPAEAATQPRMNFLMRFFDLNEAASAYHRHCLSAEEKIDPVFTDAMNFVAQEVQAQAIADNPALKPEHISSKLLERRYSLQHKLDTANMKQGCSTSDSELARAHYREFSRFKRADIIKFINQSTH